MGIKITDEAFKKSVYDLVEDEYTFLEEYKTTDTKILVRHNVCNHEYKVRPYHFLKRNQRCPNCNKYKKQSAETFKKAFNKALGSDYELLSDYKGAREKVLVKHKKCGRVYEQVAYDAKIGKTCHGCAQKSFIGGRAKDVDFFKKEFNMLSDGEYKLLSEYKGDSEYIKIEHIACGMIYTATAGAFINGRRCPECAKKAKAEKQRWTHERFIEAVKKQDSPDYEVIGTYVDYQTKVEFLHKKCNYKYSVRPADFLSGKRCPKCRSSKGEKLIFDILKKSNFEFKSQYKINSCKIKRPLPFDFAVFCNERLVLIEYQGIQHYTPIDFFGGEAGFKERVIHDLTKKNFCKNNNIELIEIPYHYTEQEVEDTLKNKLC